MSPSSGSVRVECFVFSFVFHFIMCFVLYVRYIKWGKIIIYYINTAKRILPILYHRIFT